MIKVFEKQNKKSLVDYHKLINNMLGIAIKLLNSPNTQQR